jgi:hypothetical protein
MAFGIVRGSRVLLVMHAIPIDSIWIENASVETGYRVYFVDFGNEEILPLDHLGECPETLRLLPWQSVQIKLAHLQVTDDERFALLRQLEGERLEMKVLDQEGNVYLVDLNHNGQSISDRVIQSRLEHALAIEPNEFPVVSIKVNGESTMEKLHECPIDQSLSNVDELESKLPVTPTLDQVLQTATTTNSNPSSDNFAVLVNEQRRQNRLLEQVIAAISTSNALLAQLVHRLSLSECTDS